MTVHRTFTQIPSLHITLKFTSCIIFFHIEPCNVTGLCIHLLLNFAGQSAAHPLCIFILAVKSKIFAAFDRPRSFGARIILLSARNCSSRIASSSSSMSWHMFNAWPLLTVCVLGSCNAILRAFYRLDGSTHSLTFGRLPVRIPPFVSVIQVCLQLRSSYLSMSTTTAIAPFSCDELAGVTG